MSAHTREHRTDTQKFFCVIVNLNNSKNLTTFHLSHQKELEKVLEKYSEDDDTPVAWEVLAKERIEKYKKSGLVLRGTFALSALRGQPVYTELGERCRAQSILISSIPNLIIGPALRDWAFF